MEMRVCSVSGHRLKDLRGVSYYSGPVYEICKELKRRLEFMHRECGLRTILSGFATGFDLIAVLAIQELRLKGININLVACLPSNKSIQTKYYDAESRDLYDLGIELSEMVIRVDQLPEYQSNSIKEGLMNRNQFMLDASTCSIICFNHKYKGGTRHFYNRAINRHTSVIDLKSLQQNDKVLQSHSRGDKRYSPLVSEITMGDVTQTIEAFYQGAKNFGSRSIDYPKGVTPNYFEFNGYKFGMDRRYEFMKMMWVIYFLSRPLSYYDLQQYHSAYDKFAGKNPCNQGTIITEIMSGGIFTAMLSVKEFADECGIDFNDYPSCTLDHQYGYYEEDHYE